MKALKSISILSLFLVLLMSCGGNTSAEKATDKSGPEYTSRWICPMHCEGSGAAAAGTCPACKMDYVENQSHPHAGHNH